MHVVVTEDMVVNSSYYYFLQHFTASVYEAYGAEFGYVFAVILAWLGDWNQLCSLPSRWENPLY